MLVGPANHSAFEVSGRGYGPSYRIGETNHCPGCGRTQWFVGRISAECSFCGTALPLRESVQARVMALHTIAIVRSSALALIAEFKAPGVRKSTSEAKRLVPAQPGSSRD